MEMTARKKIILKAAARKVQKVVNSSELTLEQVDAELEANQKALTAMFGAEGAEEVMQGILEVFDQQDAMANLGAAALTGLVKGAVDEEMKAHKAKKKQGKSDA